MTRWTEVAAGVHVRRYESDDLTVVVIEGPVGLIVVDSRGNPHQAEQLMVDIAQLSAAPVLALINTHAHYDHTFGNQVFGQLADVTIWGHHRIPDHFVEYEQPRLSAQQADPGREPDKHWEQVVLTSPTNLVTEDFSIDFGGRRIELIPLGRGHTDTDLAIHVPDAGVWVIGDVIEESGPPMFGSGCFPLSWPHALSHLAGRMRPDDVVIPGHGHHVDRDFVLHQAVELRVVADAIERGFECGQGVDDAIRGMDVAWPDFLLRTAFEYGYAQLRSRP